jgi:hypothetical protein
MFDFDFGSFFNFPDTRRGRATASSALPIGSTSRGDDNDLAASISVSKNANEDTDVIAKLIDSVMREVMAQPRSTSQEKPAFQ